MNNLIKQIVESKFNFNIDIEDNKMQSSLSKSKYNSKSLKELYELSQYVVDLGLPSGTLWCKYNLGCNYDLLNNHFENTIPKDWYGDYYAWGEIETKSYYSWRDLEYPHYDYKYATGNYDSLTKYCTDVNYSRHLILIPDNLSELQLEDDAAYQNMHLYNYKFKIPDKDLFEELLEYTTSKFIRNYNINGNEIEDLNGRELTSIKNGNKLFIPAAGYHYKETVFDYGHYCILLSSNINIDIPSTIYALHFNPSSIKISQISERCYGYTIRPVLYTN